MKKKIIIVGGHEQACEAFDLIVSNNIAEVVLCICRKDDIGFDKVFPSLLRRAIDFNIPHIQPKGLTNDVVFSEVMKVNADLVLSLQNNMIFGAKWVDYFSDKLGIVNVHFAPLPKYAGFWPEMWAIWNDESSFGVSLHYVGIGIDSGPIIAQRYFSIEKNEHRFSLYTKSSKNCSLLLEEKLPMLLEKKQKAVEQDVKLRSYFPKALPNGGFIDLSWDKETIERFIRAIAFPGFPGPKIRIGDSVYTILMEDLQFFLSINIK